MPGRPPKPTRLRLIQGNPGKRALPKNEPRPVAKAPSCPPWLSKEAKTEWKRIAPKLLRLGLLTEIDRAALAGYCQCWARWREAERAITRHGMTFVTESGYVCQRPEVGISKHARQGMRAFLAEFGMSPASRTRVAASRPEVLDEMEELLRGG
jgi:P27 family predicted phage terminase small subunit